MSDKVERKLKDIVEDFDTAILVTQSVQNHITGRPMSIAEFDEDSGSILFSTSLNTEKVQEIESQPGVAVVFQSATTFASLSGRAKISNDRLKIAELFDDVWKLWYPEGPTQPDIRLIRFEPDFGEYWNFSGMEGVKFAWEATKALARGKKMDETGVEQHGETRL